MTFAEDLLHHIWKFRLFSQNSLVTTSGLPVLIQNNGFHNHHAGPDFENALIRIGDTTWAGTVEIHLKSSDWEKHGHHTDPAYNNVILHVVHRADREVFLENGTTVAQLVISDIPDILMKNYHSLMHSLNWIPCEKHLSHVEEVYIRNWLLRVLIERLEEKSKVLHEVLGEYRGSWDDSFYVILARNFGFKTNALPFDLLARSLPQQLLSKHKANPLQIEALVFGQAGFLDQNYTGTYPNMLKAEYEFLKKKYSLTPIDHFTWKYMRLRPQNFPCVRLAQFAALILKSNHLFSRILELQNVQEIISIFSDLPINRYWDSHYRFDVPSEKTIKQIGNQSINNILINTVTIFLFAFGRHMGRQEYIDRSMELLENLPAENSQLIKRFIEIGFKPKHADHSQALIQLKRSYCDVKKCLNCGIGVKLLKQ